MLRKMKKRLAMKRAKKFFVEYCDKCGSKTMMKKEYSYTHPLLGMIKILCYHEECPICGLTGWDYDMLGEKYFEEHKQRRKLLLQNYNPTANEYFSLKQMALLESRTENEILSDSAFNIFVYHLNLNGTRIYLKKSYEMFRKSHDGRFRLV